MSRRARSVAVLAAVALIAIDLAGCSGSGSSPPRPAPVPSPSDLSISAASSAPAGAQGFAVVAPSQAQRVATAIDTAIQSAVTGQDVARAGGRVVGPARQGLAAAITVAKARSQTPNPLPSLTAARLVLPTSGPWPRWFLVGGTASGLPTPVVELFLSSSPRAPYGLWGRLSVLPGASLPEAAAGAAGAQTLPSTATGLVMTPSDVASRYADLLNRGPASDYVKQFGADTFRTQLNERLAKDRAAIVSNGLAKLNSTHAVQPGAIYALRTVDGGALVIAALTQSYVVDVTSAGGAVSADPDLAALAGRAQFATHLERTAVELLAFAVPAAGSTGPVQLVAASKADIAAKGS